tara:strand:- start:681 stop:1073 length:393 start_codon:yes stop_codon:yes gene_type:complete
MSLINHPAHYNNHPSRIEAIDIIENFNFCLGNAFKYIFRYQLKGGSEDLNKALWYLERQVSSSPLNVFTPNEELLNKAEALIRAEGNKDLKTIYQNIFSYQFEGAHPKVIWESIEILRKLERGVRERETN